MSTAVNPTPGPSDADTDASWTALAERSRLLIQSTQTPTGAWPASPDFAPYGYSWFRDGAFIAEGASVSGLVAEAAAFHDWCEVVLRREQPAIENAERAAAAGAILADSDYLPARYDLDGSRHDDDWWNFQVDGYGTWLWSVVRHIRRHRVDPRRWRHGMDLAMRYLTATGLLSCRDWWEEARDQTHVATLAGVSAGLRSALELDAAGVPAAVTEAAAHVVMRADELIATRGVRDGHFVKWLDGVDVDASLLSVSALYEVVGPDDPRARTTADLVDVALTSTTAGPTGVHRYTADTFYGGGQWPVLACLLATHHLRAGSRERAGQLLDWVVSVADDDLLLPEQTDPRLAPDRLAEWNERWGTSAHPLLWSHGAFLSALDVWRRT